MKIGHILLISTMILMTGCASSQCKMTDEADTNTDATAQIAEAAAAISQSLSELATVTRATTTPNKRCLPSAEDCPGLTNTVSIDWSGPVEPLVRRLADAAGYRMRVLGVRPAIPAIVTISAKDTRVGDLIRDIAFQSGGKINISVLPRANVIEMRYNNP